ncbi:MAG: FAD-binding oxidoreductase [Candidatus Kapaibacterium sp.]
MTIRENDSEIEGFLTDASNFSGGYAERVYQPETEDEVKEILAQCSRDRIPVTISGAGTGLAGGRIPFGGVVLSMARMNRIIEIDEERGHAIVEAGVILQDFQNEVESRGLLYPPDPTERGGQLGGNFSTNASGARTFKYGPTRSWVAGADLIRSNGEKISLARGVCRADGYSLRIPAERESIQLTVPRYNMPATSKHAAGYFAAPDMDGLDLFIGSEGTLGVVTQIGLRLIPKPERLFSGIVFFDDEEKMLSFVEEARDRSRANRQREVSESFDVRALEFIDPNALDFIRETYPTIPESVAGGAIWFEQETTEGSEDQLITAWAELIERHTSLANDSWFGLTESDQERMRKFRHAVPSSAYEYIAEHRVRKFGTDMAVPDNRFREMYKFYKEQLATSGVANLTWGHIGNSHLHVNILPSNEEEIPKAKLLYDLFVTEALKLGGTVSAEHGIGKIKRPYLRQMFGDEGIEEMRRVKQTMDPAGILGIGTMIEGPIQNV